MANDIEIKEVTIGWEKNRLTGGVDDPHKGTPYEGTYAVLKVKTNKQTLWGRDYIHFRVSDGEYSDDIRGIIGQIMEKFRQCSMCGCVPECACEELYEDKS